MRYADYAEYLLRRKIATGRFSTKKGRRTWADLQDLHLIPAFGDWYIDQIRRFDVQNWLEAQARRVHQSKVSPTSVNNRLRTLISTLRSAIIDLELEIDPTVGVDPVDTSKWHTYTEEEPNSLSSLEVPFFLTKAIELYPQHFAMFSLGISTGRRPCELRALRRNGPTSDILWDKRILLVRRSEAMGEVNDRTKTKKNIRIVLPEDLVEILLWHAKSLPEGPMLKSELIPQIISSVLIFTFRVKKIHYIAFLNSECAFSLDTP